MRCRSTLLAAAILAVGLIAPLSTTPSAEAAPAPHCWLRQGPPTPEPDDAHHLQVVVESNCSGDVYLQVAFAWDPGGHVAPGRPAVIDDLWPTDRIGAAYWAS